MKKQKGKNIYLIILFLGQKWGWFQLQSLNKYYLITILYKQTLIHLLYKLRIQMSLFVGNVSKKVIPRDFEEQFKFYGRCKVDLRKRFAFVQYDNERDAENAKKNLQNRNFCGLRLNIEWSKNSGRFNENTKNNHVKNRRSRSRDKSWRRDDRWYRRSPSYQRRSSPALSNHQNIESFQPKCPRDEQLLKRIKTKVQQNRLQMEGVQKERQYIEQEKNHKMQNEGEQGQERQEKQILHQS